MKAKLKSANKFSGLMLAHGEKLGMAAVLVVAGLLIKSSLGRERLPADKQPPQLSQKAGQAQQHYENMKFDDFPPEEKVDVALLKPVPGGGVIKPVNSEWYPNPETGFNPPVIPPVGLRLDPDLLAPVKLEVNSASGLWAFDNPEVIRKRALDAAARAQRRRAREDEERRRDEDDEERGRGRRGRDRDEYRGGGEFRGGYGGMSGIEMTDDNVAVIRPNMASTPEGIADIRNESWVSVLAKVPIKQQVDQYKEALANASGYNEQYDMPKYIGYVVQRAEVTEEGQKDWVNLDSVGKQDIIKAMEVRPIEPPELADERYTHPLLTWPLPPMVLRAWGDEVTHSDLPVPNPEELYAEEMAAAEAAAAPKKGEESDDEFANELNQEAAAAAPTGEFGRGEGMGRGYGGPMTEMGPPGGYGRGYGGEMGGEFGRGGRGGYGGEMAMGRGAGAYQNLPDKPWDLKTKYYLFRYYDSTVEPGRRYRYRVRLVLADVNSDSPERRVRVQYLDKAVTDRKAQEPKPYRVTDWSEPSPVAAVPQPGLIYMAKVTPANPASASSEPEALVLIKTLDADNVAEVGLAAEFLRGSVVNVIKEKAQIIWSGTFNQNNDEDEDEDEGPRPSPEFDFVTGLTLLDFTGGEVLNRNRELLAPARALVMDSTGRIMVEEELDDQMPVREYNAIVEEMNEARRARQDDDRGGRDEGRGRRGRGRGRGRG